jgi:hypothetical protein
MTFIGSISAPVLGGIIGGVGALTGGIIGGNDAKDAASMQANAANNAAQMQYNEWNTTNQQQQPWIQQGTTALNQLNGMIGPGGTGFQYNQNSDPSFQFTLQQGQDAMNRATANKGGVLSGSSLGALDSYSQGVASQGYQGAFNRYQSQIGNLMSIAGLGQNAGAQVGYQGNQAMNTIGNTMTSGAAASAAGIVGQGNAYTGALNNMGNTFNQYALLSQMANNPNLGNGGQYALSGLNANGGNGYTNFFPGD